jgi:uncharacterized protein YjcR
MSKYYVDKFYFDDNEVVRWKSNDSVPPEDILEEMFVDGVLDEEQIRYAQMIRKREQAGFLDAYRKRMANHVHSDEEMFEMRAAFGEGATVVNAITGQEIKL